MVRNTEDRAEGTARNTDSGVEKLPQKQWVVVARHLLPLIVCIANTFLLMSITPTFAFPLTSSNDDTNTVANVEDESSFQSTSTSATTTAVETTTTATTTATTKVTTMATTATSTSGTTTKTTTTTNQDETTSSTELQAETDVTVGEELDSSAPDSAPEEYVIVEVEEESFVETVVEEIPSEESEISIAPDAEPAVESVIEEENSEEPDTPQEPASEASPEVVPTEPAPQTEAPSTALVVSDSDYILLCNAVAHEAGANWITATEKAKVVEVIMNRVASSKYPNTIYGVLTQKNQFSGASSYVNLGKFSSKVTDLVKAGVDLYLADPSQFNHGYYGFWGDGKQNHFR